MDKQRDRQTDRVTFSLTMSKAPRPSAAGQKLLGSGGTSAIVYHVSGVIADLVAFMAILLIQLKLNVFLRAVTPSLVLFLLAST